MEAVDTTKRNSKLVPSPVITDRDKCYRQGRVRIDNKGNSITIVGDLVIVGTKVGSHKHRLQRHTLTNRALKHSQ